MNWQERIVTDPHTLFGKPRIAGTRIGVEFLFDLLASGWNETAMLEAYPPLKSEDLQDLFAFGRDSMKSKLCKLQAKAPAPASS